MNKTRKVFIKVIAALVMAFLALVSLTSCKTHEVVVGTNTSTEIVEKLLETHDSIYMHDSVFVSLIERGDTVYQEKCIYKTKYIYKPYKETVYVTKTDSVNIPYPVEKKLSKWAQVKVNYGGYAIVTLLLSAIAFAAFCLNRIKI